MQLSGRVLITGITGSLGTALVDRAMTEGWDCQITGIARNETKVNVLQSKYRGINCEIGDVRDGQWLRTIFPGHETIIHAAAIKIVPVAEANPREAVLTNVIGSLNVAQAAVESGVGRVICISTDKACGPTYYGLTKRLMEGIARQADDWGDTEFVLCRYGNVLNSNNSIIPLFLRQIAEDKPFTITDRSMTRFWLSMKQAVDLILYTLAYARCGEIFVPIAPAMSLRKVARTLDPDREIIEIGIRPGERLHETLIVREESLHTRRQGKNFVISPPNLTPTDHLPYQYEYTSDDPDHELTSAEFLALLNDSQ